MEHPGNYFVTLSPMTKLLAACMLLLVTATPLLAAGLVTPDLSAPLPTARFFDPDRFLTNGGVRFSAASDLTLQPEWGVSYRELERDIPGGIEGGLVVEEADEQGGHCAQSAPRA